MEIMQKKPRISEYKFLELFVSTMVVEKRGMVISKTKLQHDLVKVYDNRNLHFLFEDVCKRESVDDSYVDLNEAFLNAQALGLLTMVHDVDKDIKYIINLSEQDAHDLISHFNGNEMYAMIYLINQINNKTGYEVLLEAQSNYLLYLKHLADNNPAEAKRIATESLISAGIIDESCNLAAPYNGENVGQDDFTRGPKTLRK